MAKYGSRPQDLVTDSRGNALRGVTLKLYGSEAEANAGGTPDATVVTDAKGAWSHTAADGSGLWARVATDGSVWQVAAAATNTAEVEELGTRVTALESLNVVANGSTTTTADGTTDGQLVGYWVKSGAATINGAERTAGIHIFAWDSDTSAWLLASSGSGVGADTTAPTVGTMSVTATDDVSISVSVSGASDETALAAAPYSFSSDDGSTWSTYQAGSTYTFTGLTPSTSYDLRHRVVDEAGNASVGATVTESTAADSSLPPVAGYAAFYDALDASTITTSGSEVTQWADKSGNAKHLTPSGTGPSQSTVGGLNVIDCATGQKMVTAASSFPSDDLTLVVIAGYRDGGPQSNTKWATILNGAGAHASFQRPTNVHWNVATANGADDVVATVSLDTLNFGGLTANIEELAAGTSDWRVNGTTGSKSTLSQGQFIPPADHLDINNGNAYVFYAAIVVYQTALSAGDLTTLRTWAQARYGTP